MNVLSPARGLLLRKMKKKLKANTRKDRYSTVQSTRHVIGRRDAQEARSVNQREEDTFPDIRSLDSVVLIHISIGQRMPLMLWGVPPALGRTPYTLRRTPYTSVTSPGWSSSRLSGQPRILYLLMINN